MNLKKIYDLSVTLLPHMPIWPTNPMPEIVPIGIMSRDGYNVEKLDFSTPVSYTHLTLPTNREV